MHENAVICEWMVLLNQVWTEYKLQNSSQIIFLPCSRIVSLVFDDRLMGFVCCMVRSRRPCVKWTQSLWDILLTVEVKDAKKLDDVAAFTTDSITFRWVCVFCWARA